MEKFLLILAAIFFLFQGCSKDSDPVGDGKVIILMYHIISEGEATDLYERSASDFESDLMYLKNNDIKVIGFEELESMIRNKVRPAGNSAVITFDDGDRSWLSNVKPVLLKHGMKATFFLWVSQIGTESFLTWEEVDLMSHYTGNDGNRPFTFASHTLSHNFLLDMKASFSDSVEYKAYLDEELGGSKEYIEQYTPGPIKVLSLPYGNGAGDRQIMEAARRNGYSCIRTSTWDAISPWEADLFNLPSLPMLNESVPEIIGEYLGIE